MKEGYGSNLLKHPELVQDMVRAARQSSALPISIKIRVSQDLAQTVELARRAESVGCSFITVHGRRPDQRSTAPANVDAIRMVKQSVSVPVMANGTVWNDRDAVETQRQTGVDGVMVARALLQNPALFAGYETVPTECVTDYLRLALDLGAPFQQLHNHLMFMFYALHSRQERAEFNSQTSVAGIIDFFRRRGLLDERTTRETRIRLDVSEPLFWWQDVQLAPERRQNSKEEEAE
jgi:tRNA-dihydrouridine synthase 4